MTTKIIIFAANPLDTEQLGLRREFRYIEEARKDSKNKHKFIVLRVVAATVDDLQREILEETPRIVHFCGHGLGEKGLVWNACYSQAQAAAIEQHINYVIGTKKAIRDDAAIAFSQAIILKLAVFTSQ